MPVGKIELIGFDAKVKGNVLIRVSIDRTAPVTNFSKKDRKIMLSIKALEIAEEKEAVAQFGSSDSGASLGDILGAALKNRNAE